MSKWREVQGVLPVLSTPFNANDEIYSVFRIVKIDCNEYFNLTLQD